MKRLIVVLAALSLLVACNGKKNEPAPQVCPEGAVDLGIVMTRADGTTYKLFWAKFNLSASGLCSKPEDYGDFYAWGETEPKSDYSWAEYKWCQGTNTTLTKYNTSSSYGPVDPVTGTTDQMLVLQRGDESAFATVDDAARAKLGGKWRMPTDAEWKALRTQCEWSWITENGIAGRLVVSRTNGNRIFLPAAGSLSQYNERIWGGSKGFYWSSSLYEKSPDNARLFTFEEGGVTQVYTTRESGHSIRPVSE